jgi:hypothetical protein
VLFDAGTVRAYTSATEKLHKAGTIAPIHIEKATS